MLTDVIDLWENLRLEATASGQYLERLVWPDNPVEVIIGMGKGQLAFNILANFPSDWPRQARVPKCMSCTHSGTGEGQTISLRLRDPALEGIFIWFTQDVGNRLRNQAKDEAAHILGHALKQWAEAFRLVPDGGMSRQAQQGLFAELFFLEKRLYVDDPERCFAMWHSQHSVHDFQHERSAWEIKSFAGRRPEVWISGEDQLDETGLDALYLAVVSLKVSEEAGTDISEQVEHLMAKIEPGSENELLFKTGLAKYGYIDPASIVDRYFFTPKSLAEYRISEHFPRITRNTLPSAIHSVKYKLSLASLEAHLVSPIQEY